MILLSDVKVLYRRPSLASGASLAQLGSDKAPAAQLSTFAALRNLPPLTLEFSPLAVLRSPPLTLEKSPLAVLSRPPLTLEFAPLALF
jgi:hypothetical protein